MYYDLYDSDFVKLAKILRSHPFQLFKYAVEIGRLVANLHSDLLHLQIRMYQEVFGMI
ncbi:hypothetical protein D3C87_2192020 [compost metagenome]